jgi:hypothetical protein
VSDFDEKLIELISTLTDECQVIGLRGVVDGYGKDRSARVIRDGFAGVIRLAEQDDIFHITPDEHFLRTKEAVRVIGLRRISWRYMVAQTPAAIALEDEPNLVFKYAADDPEAITEVRRRHAERREEWERRRAAR